MRITNSLLIFLILVLSLPGFAGVEEALAPLPVQSGGRVKPYDTFARESLRLVYGKSSYKSQKDGSKKSAAEVVFTWMLLPDHWYEIKFFEIVRNDIKENLKLDTTRKYFSPKEITENSRLSLLFQELQSHRADGAKLDPYYQAVQRLEGQLNTFQAVATGYALTIVPSKSEDGWMPVPQFDENWKERFRAITSSFASAIQGEEEKVKELSAAVSAFISAARAENPSNYPSDLKIMMEIHYNSFHPFRWAWVLYLISSLAFLSLLIGGPQWTSRLGWVTSFVAFLIHTYGFALRVYLTERPPVSNMYETVIWVAWGAVLFAYIFEYLQKKKPYYIFAAALLSVLSLIVADVSPNVLDPTLQPLEAVLRSNFWLIIHVMTICLGYSAFFLAFFLSDIGLWFFYKDEKGNRDKIKDLTQATYRAVQVGVVLLAAGTILGGVWADYSWGRFWGWDPKETWAFIALMGYIAVLHGRLAGWLRDFGFMVWTAVCFSLVLMAWYGVNFVLGAGLHSYGFGAGGVEYVAGFVALELLFIAFVATVRRARIKKQ